MVARWFAGFALFFVCIIGGAGRSIGAPSAQRWYESLSPKDPATGVFVHRILLVKGIKDGHLLTLDLDIDGFGEGSYLELIEGRESEVGYLLNQRSDTIQDYHTPKDELEPMFAAAFRFTSADTIIYAPAGAEHWSFYRPDPKLGAKKEFMVKGPEQANADAIKQWIIAKIGYNGVLLAQDNNYVLVAMYKELQEGASAMLVQGSEGTLRIKKSELAGSALRRRLDCHRGVCVFEVMIQAMDRYPLGSKVFF